MIKIVSLRLLLLKDTILITFNLNSFCETRIVFNYSPGPSASKSRINFHTLQFSNFQKIFFSFRPKVQGLLFFITNAVKERLSTIF